MNEEDMMKEHPDSKALAKLKEALVELNHAKPGDRNEIARRYAVTITELEKVLAYFELFVAQRAYLPSDAMFRKE